MSRSASFGGGAWVSTMKPPSRVPAIYTRARASQEANRGLLGQLRLDRLKGLAKRRVSASLLEPGEVLIRVADEVEVELGEALLDDAPHRLAEVGHEANEAQCG